MKQKRIGKKDVRTEQKIVASMLCGSGLCRTNAEAFFCRGRDLPNAQLTGSPMEKPYENAWA
jgi:hypothetical protein